MSHPTTRCPTEGKHVHKSKGKAMAHLRRLKTNPHPHRGEPNVYFCPWCKGWHVGHKKKTHGNKKKR